MDFKKNPKTNFKSVDKLSKEDAQTQIYKLREAIEYHNELYYVKNAPEISDRAYDKLFKRLEELEEAFPEYRSADSPTGAVGARPVDELKKVRHRRPMLSLEAALEQQDAEKLEERINKADKSDVEYILEPKFDGLSVEMIYEQGKFIRGSTRGDGETGEDITENIKVIAGAAMSLADKGKIPSVLAVRGEIFLPKSGFTKLNKRRIEQGLEPFANPRNAAAGIVRQLDPKKVADKNLDIIFYEIIEIQGYELKDHWSTLKQLSKWGLKVYSDNLKCSSFTKIAEFHQKMQEKRDELQFEIDGIVVKVNDYEIRDKLGTRQRNPRWAFAWKFPPKEEFTTVEDIVVQVGMTGMLTPVALLEPVELGGVTVSRATLHNESEVKKKDIRKGDAVRVHRAGDVIPEVAERKSGRGRKRGKPFNMPKKCPVCGSDVEKEGAYYFCTASLSCRAQLAGRIQHYASREAMNIEGLGEKTINELVEKQMVKEIADIYNLSHQQIAGLDGFADKSANKLLDAIDQSKSARLDKFLYAMGIRHVGEHIAKVIALKFKSIDAIKDAEKQQLLEIDEVGEQIAESVANFFNRSENIRSLEHLFAAGVKVEKMPGGEESDMPLKGKTFVFTGELEDYTRSEAGQAVESLGARATSSVSGNTDYLVRGSNPGSKLDQAKKRDVDIIDEKQFVKLLKS
jgi:DNA ligase (NAD+)